MSGKITLRAITASDCQVVAGIHTRAFPGSSLTRLGLEAVRRYYVAQLDGSNECLALGAFQDDLMVGYIFAGVFHGVLTGFLHKNQVFLAGRVLTHPWLALDPMFRDAIKLALRKFKPKKSVTSGRDVSKGKMPAFVVLAIAVDPQLQKRGIGQLLMDYTEDEALQRGFMKMSLTVNPENIRAVQFYEKNGWQNSQNNFGKNIEMTKQLTA